MRWCVVVALTLLPSLIQAADSRHPVPKEHPRLFGNLAHLQGLAQARPSAYKHVSDFAHHKPGYRDYEENRIWCNSICYALEHDKDLARKAIDYVMKEYITQPIKIGHIPFGADLAHCAVVYDFCYDAWTPDERNKFIEYMNKTVEANVGSETSPYHNGYYGYKNSGIGIACYATYYENAKAPGYLATLEADIRARAEPCLEQAGDGGGWAEGDYLTYWILPWEEFCEVARTCEGIDYYAHAPKFFRNRDTAGIFGVWPGTEPAELNRPIPIGDGGSGMYQGFSDQLLTARRILCSYFRDDPVHQCINTYNQQINGMCIPEYSHLEFLFNDLTIPQGNLKAFKLSHCSPGPGFVYARSSWEHDSSYLFFKCGDRFTAHQHLDVGTFTIYKNTPLALPGGFYDEFSGNHACNYYIRTIGCNSMLIFDPAEKFPDGIRAGPKSFNDGGQQYPLPKGWGQNWGAPDKTERDKNIAAMHIAELLAYDDQGSFMYTAGDCTKAYSAAKCDFFTRQIVFIRPDTFVIFDRVESKNPNFRKTFLLHTMKPPTGTAPNLVETNGKGRLFIQTVLPENPEVKLHTGKDLYVYNGSEGPVNPAKPWGNIPECRIEISPKTAAQTDYFLHVLTTGDDTSQQPPKPECKVGSDVALTLGNVKLHFKTGSVGGSIEINGSRFELASRVAIEPLPAVHVATPAAPVASTNGGGPAVAGAGGGEAPHPKSAEPTAEAKAQSAQRYAELRAAVITGASAGKKEAVNIDVYGAPTNAKVVGASDKALSVAVEGLGDAIVIPWEKLDALHFYQVARRYSDDHRALFEYCEGAGMSKEAESEAAKR